MDSTAKRKIAESNASTMLSREDSWDDPSQDSAQASSTPVSAFTVPNYERTTYYYGIAGENDQPDLLHRTGSDKYPWIRPTDRYTFRPYNLKSIHGVFSTPLNDVWSTVGSQISEKLREVTKSYSFNVARFCIHGEDGESTVGPVVIWIRVNPGSTSADTTHEASQNIIELLNKSGVADVEVEWYEGVVQRL